MSYEVKSRGVINQGQCRNPDILKRYWNDNSRGLYELICFGNVHHTRTK